jgi:hypothetical protein
MFGTDDSRLSVGHMESLRDELPAMLAAVGEPVSDDMRAYIGQAALRNATPHARYAEYYDDELRERASGQRLRDREPRQPHANQRRHQYVPG